MTVDRVRRTLHPRLAKRDDRTPRRTARERAEVARRFLTRPRPQPRG